MIEACEPAGATPVFLDNAYTYGRVDGPMTEGTATASGHARGAFGRLRKLACLRGRISNSPDDSAARTPFRARASSCSKARERIIRSC